MSSCKHVNQDLYPKALPSHTPGNLRAYDICKLSIAVSRFLRGSKKKRYIASQIEFCIYLEMEKSEQYGPG